MSAFWTSKRVLVTGGTGFLGSRVVHQLRAEGAELFVPRSRDYNLIDGSAVARLFSDTRPNIVIHAAAVVGGIGANQAHPGRFLYENLMMGTQVMETARVAGVEKLVAIGTICAYPKFTRVPFLEEHLWDGYPEETNAAYGLAKKMLLVQGQAYRREYGFNSIHLLPVNLYGPGDNFEPSTSHVIPSLILKMVEAVRSGRDEVAIWGTGMATREFLHVDDCVTAIIQAAQHYDGGEPVNVGTGIEISIKELANLIARLTGYSGKLVWDSSKPDGQPRRCVDTGRAERLFGFRSRIELVQGLRETIRWYETTVAQPYGRPVDLETGMPARESAVK